MKERVIICVVLLLIAWAVCGCKKKPNERFICPHCKKHTTFLLKPKPIVLERRVGAVVEVDYTVHCNLCEARLDPNTASYRTFFGWE